jgi:hypothetical protein
VLIRNYLVATDDDGRRSLQPGDDEEGQRGVQRVVAQRQLRPQRRIFAAQVICFGLQLRQPCRGVAVCRAHSLHHLPVGRRSSCVLERRMRALAQWREQP